MDRLKFYTALNILYKQNKKRENNDYNNGYATALYDVLQAAKLCENDKSLNLNSK